MSRAIGKSSGTHGAPPRIKVVHIQSNGYSLAPTLATATSTDQFSQFISWVVKSKSDDSVTSAQLTVACAIAFEVLRSVDLLPFLNALKDRMRLSDGTYVTWSTPDGLNRRKVCPFTALAFSKCNYEVNWSAEISTFDQHISKIYHFGTTLTRHRTLATVLLDCQAWAYLNLPMPLVASYLQVLPITPLPDSAWYRRHRLIGPSPKVVAEVVSDPLEDADVLVSGTLMESPMALSGIWVINELLNVCTGLCGVGVSISNTRARRQLTLNINRIARKLDRAGPNEALMVGWAIYLVRYGSAYRADPKVSTVARYLSAGLRAFYSAMRVTGSHPYDLDTSSWEMVYRNLLREQGNDSTFRNTVISFHVYLIRTLDVEPQHWLFNSTQDRRHIPRANMIWSHEIDALPEAIRCRTTDTRTAEQVVTWSVLLTSIPMRVSELKWIRLSDVNFCDGQVEVAILARRHAGNGKTKAAQRICRTDDQRCIDTLSAWRIRREKEGAELDDLLFGDPKAKEKLYRFGASYSLLNQSLKAVVGESDFSSHLCRHTVISHAMEKAILTLDNAREVNPLNLIKVAAGHKSAETTISIYFHLPENCIRYWVDYALRQMTFTYKQIEAWTGIKASTLAQTQHRRKSLHWHVIDAVQSAETAQAQVFTEVTKFDPVVQKMPLIAPRIELAKIVNIVADYQVGHGLEALALRNAIDASLAQNIVNTICYLHGQLTMARKDTAKPASSTRCRLDFSRMSQPRWVIACTAATSQSDEALGIVGRYWLEAVRNGTISVKIDNQMPHFLQFLKVLGIGVNRIVVRTNGEENDDAQYLIESLSVRESLISIFGLAPQFEALRFRRGRPVCTLQVLTKPANLNCVAAAATNDTQTLNALIFCINVLIRIRSKEEENAQA